MSLSWFKIKEKEEKTKANDILKKEIIRKLELKIFDIGHMIVNKDTAGQCMQYFI